MTREERAEQLREIGSQRILIKDGPYGSMIQSYKLDEEGFRGGRTFNHDQKGNNDLLNLTRPDVVGEICNAYLDAGADIVATNTFNSNSISLSDYGITGMAREINVAAAKLTRACADAATARDPSKPRFVAGALGPTNKTLSVSPKVSDPGFRAVTFDEVKDMYREQIDGLLDGGVDFIFVNDRRAHQRHRLGPLQEADPRGRLHGRLEVAREQVENGAQIIDVNMDEGMLDAEAGDGDVPEPDRRRARHRARAGDDRQLQVERDRGRAEVRAGQGPIVNSISMKEGEEPSAQARKVRRYGAAVVVMAFDEKGQADTKERKVEICTRAYDILVNQVGFPPEDIIFDPNVFAVATGIEEHDNYGVDFIEATREIKATLPACHISGGVSNLSFAFRGNEPVREAMHSVFLYHAIKAGMDMGIVNAGQLASTTIDPVELREACEDVILNRRPDATERLLEPWRRDKGGRGQGRRTRPGAALAGRRSGWPMRW
jgi:hypothetical protein